MKILEYTQQDAGVDIRSGSVPYSKLAQRFQLKHAAPVGRISLYMKRTGSPVGYLRAVLYTDSSDLPDTAVSNGASDPVLVTSVSTNYGWVNFDFDNDLLPELNASTDYHIALEATGYTYSENTTSATWGVDQTNTYYADGEGQQYNGAAWADLSTASDFAFKLFTSPDGRTDTGYASISQVERICKQYTNSGEFDFSTTADIIATEIYEFADSVADQVDAWFASAGFETPVTNAEVLRMIRMPSTYGLAMMAESTQRTAGFRGERGADTKMGAYRSLFYNLKDDLLGDDADFIDALVAVGLEKEAASQLGRGLSAGGVEDDEHDDWDEDTTLFKPTFQRDMWDNP